MLTPTEEKMTTNPIELDEIIQRVVRSFSGRDGRQSLGRIASTTRRNRDLIEINRTLRGGAVMQGAMERYKLTKFPLLVSLDQKIKEVVPPFWILATAMSNHATSEERRLNASEHFAERYMARNVVPPNYDPNFQLPTDDHFRRIESEAYFHQEYVYHPERTLRQFFQGIAEFIHSTIDINNIFSPTLTAPELLRLAFTTPELRYYGW